MSKEQDEKTSVKTVATSAPAEVSGSTVKDFDIETSKAEPRPLVESIETYTSTLSSAQKAAIREYHITCFPGLFTVRGYNTDVDSKHPALEMTEPAKFYAALREENIRILLKKAKEKTTH